MSQEDLQATGKQRSEIAKLSFHLGIQSPIESGMMSMAQAGKQIRHLRGQLKLGRRSSSMAKSFMLKYGRRLR